MNSRLFWRIEGLISGTKFSQIEKLCQTPINFLFYLSFCNFFGERSNLRLDEKSLLCIIFTIMMWSL